MSTDNRDIMPGPMYAEGPRRVLRTLSYRVFEITYIMAFMSDGSVWKMNPDAVEAKWKRLPDIPKS
jgi:hypothetical protein